MKLAMLNDKLVRAETLDPVYLDRGVYFGDGVYEVMRSYNGKLFAFEEHMERFARSLAEIRIDNISIDVIGARVQRAFEAAALPNAKIYFHVTRGSAPRNHVWAKDIQPNFFLTIGEVGDSTPEKTKGIAVSTHPDWRWKRCDIKSLNLLPNILARQDAADKGCDEAVLVDEAGFITEGAGSGFFAIVDSALQTAPLTANILPSITRKFIVQAAENIGLRIEENCMTPQQAIAADELFIAVTTKDIVPVVTFDGAAIGNGKPGPHTQALIKEFQKFTA